MILSYVECQQSWMSLISLSQILALSAVGSGMLSLSLQITSLTFHGHDQNRLFFRAAEATAALTLVLFSVSLLV